MIAILPHLRYLVVFVTTTDRWEEEQALIRKPDKQVRQSHDRNGNGVQYISFYFYTKPSPNSILNRTQSAPNMPGAKVCHCRRKFSKSHYFSWAGNSLPML